MSASHGTRGQPRGTGGGGGEEAAPSGRAGEGITHGFFSGWTSEVCVRAPR